MARLMSLPVLMVLGVVLVSVMLLAALEKTRQTAFAKGQQSCPAPPTQED